MNEKFEMTYPNETHEEVKRVREKYAAESDAKKNDKLAQLKKLDESVTGKASTAALAIGIFFCLVFGLGMAFCLSYQQHAVGIIVGISGAVGMAIAYPVYKAVFKKQKARVADKIIKLSDELLGK